MKIIYILILLLFSCKTPDHYNVIGVIKEIDKKQQRMLIDHDEIPGFMVQMVMYFNIHESINLDNFSVNDSVSFDLLVKDKDSYTINFKKYGKSLINISDNNFWEDNDDDPNYSLKEPGDYIIDGSFLTTSNKEVKLSEIVSKYSIISFIFSKCPMPNMCPASIVKNQYLANHFIDEDINFVIISFDYMYDTPSVMSDVYGSIETENIRFLSSYKHINDIFSLTQQSGITYWGVEENNIGHSMRSILVDENLKLITYFDGIDWKPGDAKNTIENLIKINR